MHEIKIYGEVIPFEDNWIIEQGGYVNLTEVQRQLKEANGSDVRVRINSCGGDCDAGFAIYSELRRYAKENKAKVETFGEARVQSIATVIFLAGDERILTEHTEPFVHNAWCYEMGDSKKLMRIAADLQKYNERIANHYAQHTDLTTEEALALMDAETSITVDEALAMRFATSIEEVLRPVALKRFTTNINKNDDMDKPKRANLLAKAIKAIKEFAGAQNKILFTADERELDFYELAEDQEVTVGAKANYDGAPATGEHIMQSGETYVFDNGVLMEIREAAGDAAAEDVAALEAEAALLAENLESALALVEEQATTIAAQAATIATFKAARSAAPAADDKRTPPKAAAKQNRAAAALANLKTIKQK